MKKNDGKVKFATCLNCVDGRVQLPVICWIKKNYEADYVDMITEAGMDGVLSDENWSGLDSLMKKTDISLQREGSLNKIFIIGHYDCLGNPADDETHKKQINIAVKKLKNMRPSAGITGLWVSNDWTVEKIV